MEQPWYQVSSFGITQFLMLVGLFGLIVPIFPGLVIMWLAALGYGLMAGFGTLGWIIFAVLTVLMLVGSLIDNVLVAGGARQGGADWRTIIIALVAGVIGTLLAPPFGGIVAAPLAILILEYRRVRDWAKAREALRGLATGWGLAYVVRLGIGFLIMALWWLWVWKG